MGLSIGVLKETLPGERRVAITPKVIDVLTKAGADVLIETGAGLDSGFLEGHLHEKNIVRLIFRIEDPLQRQRVFVFHASLNSSQKVVPFPTADFKPRVPFMRSIAFFTMARPMPVPS